MKRLAAILVAFAAVGYVAAQVPDKFRTYNHRNADGTYRHVHHADGSTLLPAETRVYFPDGKTLDDKLDEAGNGGGGPIVQTPTYDVSNYFEANPGAGYGDDGDPSANVQAYIDAVQASFEEGGFRAANVTITGYFLVDEALTCDLEYSGTMYRIKCRVDGQNEGHVRVAPGNENTPCFQVNNIAVRLPHPQIAQDIPKMRGTASSPTGLDLVRLHISNDQGHCVAAYDGRREHRLAMRDCNLECEWLNGSTSAGLYITSAWNGSVVGCRFFDCVKHAIYATACTNLYFEDCSIVSTGRMARDNATGGTDSTISLAPDSSPTTAGALNGMVIDIIDGTGSGQYRTITSYTAPVATVGVEWHTVPDATSVYEVRAVGSAAFHMEAAGSHCQQLHIEGCEGMGIDLASSGASFHGWIESAHKSIREINPTYGGSIVSASGTSVILAATASDSNDEYNGHEIELDDGQNRLITDYDGASRTGTVNRAWSGSPTGNACVIRLTGQGWPGQTPMVRASKPNCVLQHVSYGGSNPLFSNLCPFIALNSDAQSTFDFRTIDRGRNLDLREMAASAGGPGGPVSEKAYWSSELAAQSGDTLGLSRYDSSDLGGNYVTLEDGGAIRIVNRAGAYTMDRWVYPFTDSAGFDGYVLPADANVICRIRYSTSNPEYFASRYLNLNDHIFYVQMNGTGDPTYYLRWWGHAYTNGVHEITAVGSNHSGGDYTVSGNNFQIVPCWGASHRGDATSPEIGITLQSVELAFCHPLPL